MSLCREHRGGPMSSEASHVSDEPPRLNVARLVALVCVIVGLILLGRYLIKTQGLDAAVLRAKAQGAGAWGALGFIGAFGLGVTLHVPGAIFVSAGVLAYGPELGFVLSLIGALIGVSANFFTTRLVAGQQLSAIKSPRLQRLLRYVDERPILAVLALRTIAFVSPPLNTALAMSRVRYVDFAIGSALGLIVPMAVVTLLLERLLASPWLVRLLFE
ncbi:MAG: DedA family protein [Myxococcales bacterium]|nr:DedA family protein [Myxococcales bacterium]